jgi:hypothetical protein
MPRALLTTLSPVSRRSCFWRPFFSSIGVELAAPTLFALAVFAGLKKLEYYVAILGADYSLAMTEENNALGARDSAAVIRDLNETVDRLSSRASFTHRFRNWCLVLGILSVIAERLLEVAI